MTAPAATGHESGHGFAIRLMQHLVVPTFVLDAQRRVLVWNRACERLTGVPAAEVIGTDEHWRGFYNNPRYCLADVIVRGETDELAQLYAAHTLPSETGVGLRAENWCKMPRAGKELYLAIDAGPIFDDQGNLIAVVETLRDMTEQKLAQMALQNLATKDGLTGIANRRALDDTFRSEWRRCQRAGSPLAFMLADVDHFKPYNDTYGHQAGDECLRSVAGMAASKVFRPADLIARYGGEEFAVIMPGTDADGALAVAERIRHGIESLGIPHKASTTSPHITLSVGVASVIPTMDGTPETLVEAADTALYQAKHRGRNRVEVSYL